MRKVMIVAALLALGACDQRGVGFSCGAGAKYCEDGGAS